AGEGLVDGVGLPPPVAVIPADHREAHAVDGDRRAHRDVVEDRGGAEAEPGALARDQGPELFHYAGEHQRPSLERGSRSIRRSGPRRWTDAMRPRVTAARVGA